MISRVDWREAWRLARAPVHRPTDVLNLIDYADRRWYLWYGLFVVPTIYGVGGSIRWGGEHARALVGAPVSQTLLIVRYPTHRHFLAMTFNPYYAAIHGFRERGVARFAASFTRVLQDDSRLRDQASLIGVHYEATDLDRTTETIVAILREAKLSPRYRSIEFARFSFLSNLRPSDPNPLPYPATLLFGADAASADGGALEEAAQRLAALPERLCAHVYERSSKHSYLPLIGERRR